MNSYTSSVEIKQLKPALNHVFIQKPKVQVDLLSQLDVDALVLQKAPAQPHVRSGLRPSTKNGAVISVLSIIINKCM